MYHHAVNWCDRLRFFAFIYLSLNCKQSAICRTNLQLLKLAGISSVGIDLKELGVRSLNV